jgi:cysteine synthase
VTPVGLAPPPAGVSADLVATIGETPLVELHRVSPNPDVRILAKLESHNPTGSIKDRTALALIDDAERRGAIRAGDTIMEPTSGNTGISLAMICRVRGYRLVAVMPENVTQERRQLLTLYGAEIVDTDGEFGSNGAVEVARRLAAENGLYMPFQYGNPANPRAHYEGTAEEIVRDCPEIDVFVAGLGTGGTLMGSSQRLKEHRPGIKVVACEPLQGDPVSGLRSLDDDPRPVPARPQAPDLQPRLDRDDAAPGRRGGDLRGGVVGGRDPHLRPPGPADGARDDRRDRLRRRLEVPVGRHLDRRRRRRRGRARPRHLLVAAATGSVSA